MPRRHPLSINNIEALAATFTEFEFDVAADDFIVYAIASLVEEDRASFEDEEFRRLVDAGIHLHIETRPDIRAAMAMRLRAAMPAPGHGAHDLAIRTLRALEDIEAPLRNLTLIVRVYTEFLFRMLQKLSEMPTEPEERARTLVAGWRQGAVPRAEMMAELRPIGPPAVPAVAEMLLETAADREVAETALELLAAIPCAASARVLAHVVSEPLLDEDLERRAYADVRRLWPLPRHYVLYELATHEHEDLPFRWYQLLIETDELDAVDRILDEFLVHGEDGRYREDLLAIIELLHLSGDPDVEGKLVAILNAPDTSPIVAGMLEGFARRFTPKPPAPDNPWERAERAFAINQRYQEAARLLDAGETEKARQKLDAILRDAPTDPFATALRAHLDRAD